MLTTLSVSGLDPGATLHFRVFALNIHGQSLPSNTAVATTDANQPPAFTGTSANVSVAENTAADTDIDGANRAATDADSDNVTYSLKNDADSSAFQVVSTTGQVRTKDPLDFETKSSYTVTAVASDTFAGQHRPAHHRLRRAVQEEVQVRATNDEGDSPYSPPGTGSTNAGPNNVPAKAFQTDGRGDGRQHDRPPSAAAPPGQSPGGGGGGGGGAPGPGQGPGPEHDPEPEPDPQPPPGSLKAAFTVDPECSDAPCRARTGEPVTFTDTSSGLVRSRTWDLGDGARSRNQTVNHAWSEPGFYEVTLTVSDGDAESTASVAFLVEAAAPAGTCVADDRTRCLQDSRYAVTVDWWTTGGASGKGSVVHAGTNDSAMFHFFGPNNWEVLIKVLDGCAINGRVWVFGAATTDLGYAIRATDTVTGTAKEYRNEPGMPAPAITDATAFAEGCRAR